MRENRKAEVYNAVAQPFTGPDLVGAILSAQLRRRIDRELGFEDDPS